MIDSKPQFLVCVRCITFNHANYIRDALNGFCMQQTSFPFICIVIDDASTDGEDAVIKQYMNDHFDLDDHTVSRNEETKDFVHTYARHKTNKNCYLAVFYLKYNHYSIKKDKTPYMSEWYHHVRYHALCEGDDYWIDPGKLQKQVDYMESHPECTICATNALTLWEKGEKAPSYFRKFYEEGEFPISQLIGNWAFATASLMYRESVLENYPNWTKQFYFGDMSLMLIAAHYGKLFVLSSITAIYRKSMNNANSVTTSLADRMDYVNQQLAQLYETFNEWTDGQYSDVVLKEIEHRRKEVQFYKYRRIGRLVPYIMMPKYMLHKRFCKA